MCAVCAFFTLQSKRKASELARPILTIFVLLFICCGKRGAVNAINTRYYACFLLLFMVKV